MISRLINYITKEYLPSGMDRSDWSAIMLTLSRWTATFSALATAMVLTRMLDPVIYGLYAKLWLIYFIFGQVLISTIASVSMQRISASKDAQSALIINLKLGFFSAIGIAFLLYIGAPLLAKWLNALPIVPAIRAFIPYIFFSVLTASMEAAFIYLKKRKNYLAFSVFFHFMNAVLAVLGFHLFEDLYKVVLFMSIIPLLRVVYMFKYVLTLFSKSIPSNKFDISTEWKATLSLLGVLFVGTLLSIASKDLDRWIVANWLKDQAEFALYAIGAKKVPLVSGLTSSISAALVAHYSGRIIEPYGKAFSERIKTHVNRFFGPILLLIVFVGFHAESILHLLYGELYIEAASYFKWYQFALLGDIIFGLTIFLVAEDKKSIFWVSFAEFSTNFILSILLMLLVGPIGVIWATVFSHILFSMIAVAIGCKKYKLQFTHFFPSFRRLIQVSVLCFITAFSLHALSLLLFDISEQIKFLFACILYGITGLIMLKKLS